MKAPTAPTDAKWVYDVRVQPVDFSDVLPAGILLGSASVSRVPASDLVVAGVIRAGSKIVDVVYAVGVALRYTVILDVTGNGQIGGITWQQRVKFDVEVQA